MNIQEYRKEYKLKNKDKLKEYQTLWNKNNKDKLKEYRKKHREKYGKSQKEKLQNKLWRHKIVLSLEEYLLLIKKQDNKCAICNMEEKGKSLAIDHDHKNGKVRGLLCQSCNQGLGRFKDNKLFLLKAIKYLK